MMRAAEIISASLARLTSDETGVRGRNRFRSLDTVMGQGLAEKQGRRLRGARDNLSTNILASTVTDKEEVIGCYKRDLSIIMHGIRNSYATGVNQPKTWD